jgi:glutamyl-tRNA reductase
VREFPQVHLYDIDDLQGLAERGRTLRKQEVAAVERLIDEEIKRFQQWLRSRGVVPTVAALRNYAEDARKAELERTFKRLRGLTAEQRAAFETMTGALVKKLLHDPIGKLKGEDGERYVAAVRELFDLDAEPSPGASNGAAEE